MRLQELGYWLFYAGWKVHTMTVEGIHAIHDNHLLGQLRAVLTTEEIVDEIIERKVVLLNQLMDNRVFSAKLLKPLIKHVDN